MSNKPALNTCYVNSTGSPREKTKKRRKEERGKESGIIQNHCGGLENELRIAWGEGWGEGIVMEFGVVLYTLIYLKWIINKDLLESM